MNNNPKFATDAMQGSCKIIIIIEKDFATLPMTMSMTMKSHKNSLFLTNFRARWLVQETYCLLACQGRFIYLSNYVTKPEESKISPSIGL